MGYINLLQNVDWDLEALAQKCELWESSHVASVLTIFLYPW